MAEVFIFSSPQPIIDAWDALHPAQRDHHVRKYRGLMAAYGSVAGWQRHVAERAERRAELERQAEVDPATAAFLKRVDAGHRAWREGR